MMTTNSVETRFFASLISPGITAKAVLAAAPQLQDRDATNPADGIIYSAIIACAVDGKTGAELVLARLREDGHLQRDVDSRLTTRLAELATTTADPLQSPALAAEIMDRAEVRLMESTAHDIIERAATLPTEARRDLMRTFWTRYRDITERVDAVAGKAGVPAERPHLRSVSA